MSRVVGLVRKSKKKQTTTTTNRFSSNDNKSCAFPFRFSSARRGPYQQPSSHWTQKRMYICTSLSLSLCLLVFPTLQLDNKKGRNPHTHRHTHFRLHSVGRRPFSSCQVRDSGTTILRTTDQLPFSYFLAIKAMERNARRFGYCGCMDGLNQ